MLRKPIKMKCKTSDWGCVYHACMSNDCQKAEMDKVGKDFYGEPNCQKTSRNRIKPERNEGIVGFAV